MINDAFPYGNGNLSDNAAWATPTLDGTLTVGSNAIAGTGDELTRGNLRTDAWTATQSSTITYVSGDNAYPGVIVHGSDSGSGLSGYIFGCSVSSSGLAGDWFLEEYAAGVASPLDSGNAGGGSAAGMTFGIGIEGNDVVAYINGVEVGRATDTTYRAGKPGVFRYAASGATPVLDNWVGTGEASSGYSLTADQGSYALNGQDATLTVVESTTLVMEFGTYSLLGSEAYADYQMAMAQGSYALNGQTADLRITAAYTLAAELGTYTYNGFAIPLVYSGAVVTAVPVNSSRRFYGHRLGR